MKTFKRIWYSESLERTKAFIKRRLMDAYRITHGVQRKVIFRSFSGNHYSDNPKAISEKMHEQYPDIEIVWMLNDLASTCVPDYVRKAENTTWGIIREYSTAMGWVDNFGLNRNYSKSVLQRYVQTWHGDRSFKKVICQSSYLGFLPSIVVENEICDLCLAGSDFGLETYRTAFLYDGPVLKLGTPRCDRLVRPDAAHAAALKVSMGFEANTRYVLYAPTFRDKEGLEDDTAHEALDVDYIVERLEQATGEKWRVLLRVHPSVAEKALAVSELGVNVSAWEDMMDLLEVADALISDYSSSVGDYILTGRPVVLFQHDLEDYERDSRELRFDMGGSPYVVARTNEEVALKLAGLFCDGGIAAANDAEIAAFYNTYETGHSAESTCRFLVTGELDPGAASLEPAPRGFPWSLT